MTQIPFDPDTIQRLAAILQSAQLTEIELRDGEQHLRLVRGATLVQAAAAPAPAASPSPPVTVADDAPPPEGAVMSPMVGVAYLSPEPGAPPYVNVGQAVAAGQTVMLIEAMKTFNQIKAPHAGTVTSILVASGAPVEYGQPLLVIA